MVGEAGGGGAVEGEGEEDGGGEEDVEEMEEGGVQASSTALFSADAQVAGGSGGGSSGLKRPREADCPPPAPSSLLSSCLRVFAVGCALPPTPPTPASFVPCAHVAVGSAEFSILPCSADQAALQGMRFEAAAEAGASAGASGAAAVPGPPMAARECLDRVEQALHTSHGGDKEGKHTVLYWRESVASVLDLRAAGRALGVWRVAVLAEGAEASEGGIQGVFLAEVQLVLREPGMLLVAVGCLAEAEDARVHARAQFTRWGEQLERDVRRSGRAWKRRLAQASAAAAQQEGGRHDEASSAQ